MGSSRGTSRCATPRTRLVWFTLWCVLALAAASDAATIVVNAGDNLQAALDAARPGDEIVLEAGARFVGGFRLPVVTGGGKKPAKPIILRSSAMLPARRITPEDAALLPIIASGSGGTALTGEGVSNWRLDGIRFESNVGGAGNVIQLQDATNIVMDRLLIVASEQGQKRAIMGNGRHITLTRSHIANIWRAGQDSQAFCAWDGAGPYTITDNYLEAASENIMFGGANSGSPDRVPADILVEGNHLFKPIAWKGTGKNVKNLFELKSARRVIVRNNLMEWNWTDGQSGFAVLFTVRNDEGGSPWSVIEDVLFERNIVRYTEGIFNILGYDSYQPSGRTTRVTIRHNLLLGSRTFLQAGAEVGTLTIDHNTVEQGGNFATLYFGDVWASGTAARRKAEFAVETLTVTNTLGYHNDWGVFGEASGIGTPALAGLTKAYTWTHNVLAGESGRVYRYPNVTWQPTVAEHQAEFNADYTLRETSWYRFAGNDGQDLGRVWHSSPEPPPPGDDTTGPVITISNVVQTPNFYRFRVNATDPSGIASVVVAFNEAEVFTGTTVPVTVEIPLRSLAPGTYPLQVVVTDGAGNSSVEYRVVVK